MDIGPWIDESIEQIRTDGYEGFKQSCRPVRNKLLSGGNLFRSSGRSIYEDDWDLLVVLDACRYDLLTEVEAEFEWLNSIQNVWSVNSTTAFWMRQTFTENRSTEIKNTAYVCGNPFSESELNPSDFAELIELWRTAWTNPGTVPPEAVTDETIRLMRNEEHDRVIAHYMQPHCPFIPSPELSKGKDVTKFGNQDWRDVWEMLRDGDVELEDVWRGYRDNLRLGLNEVTDLLQNVDAEKVIVTSDHGNSTGEWGVYGHPPNLPLTNLRKVPWIETTARDLGERSPGNWLKADSDLDRDEQLAALGYK
ncbi:hypothetical protein [Haloferax sp. Atlit-12N]|uniref:hypothetical protein n=1 Tax=Haloferax sp. Atlit-12N TaxID=2077203 RepID=UPI0011E5F0DC|nr:hypothetical protein [Haloferax sp. Atlit-12N]